MPIHLFNKAEAHSRFRLHFNKTEKLVHFGCYTHSESGSFSCLQGDSVISAYLRGLCVKIFANNSCLRGVSVASAFPFL